MLVAGWVPVWFPFHVKHGKMGLWDPGACLGGTRGMRELGFSGGLEMAEGDVVIAENPIGPEDAKMLEKNFTYHRPKGDQPAKYDELRRLGREMAERIVRLSPPSRERSLALTKLEESIMWVNAAIARNE